MNKCPMAVLASVTFWLAVASTFFCQPCLSQPPPLAPHLRQALLSLADIKGVWYLGWTADAYGFPGVSEELLRLKTDLGVHYVGLIAPLVQDSLTSSNPHPDPRRTPSVQTLAQVIEEAHMAGLGVLLLPYLLVESEREFAGSVIGDWVGDLAPADPERWFDNWRKILCDYAMLAEEEGVEIMLLGWEFESMLSHRDEWQEAIDQLRDLYGGRLSYLTNWWASREEYGRVVDWNPWGSLDFIGISAYFDLTSTSDPSPAELERAWHADANHQNIIEDLQQLSAKYDKPLAFWELGYQSKDGANQAPWNFMWRGSPDPAEQADAFSAAFSVLTDEPWFAGYVVWAEQAGLPHESTSYGVLSKPAESRIRSHLTVVSQGHLPAEEGVDMTLFESSKKAVATMSNTMGETVTGLHIAFDRTVTITNKIEIGGYLPALSEGTGTAFDFGGGELVAWGTVEISWTPVEARPTIIQWLSEGGPVGQPYRALPQMLGRQLSEGIIAARTGDPESLTRALNRFFADNEELVAICHQSLGVSLPEWLPPLLMTSPPAGIENFFNALIETSGAVSPAELCRGDGVDFSALFALLDPPPPWLCDRSAGPSATRSSARTAVRPFHTLEASTWITVAEGTCRR